MPTYTYPRLKYRLTADGRMAATTIYGPADEPGTSEWSDTKALAEQKAKAPLAAALGIPKPLGTPASTVPPMTSTPARPTPGSQHP